MHGDFIEPIEDRRGGASWRFEDTTRGLRCSNVDRRQVTSFYNRYVSRSLMGSYVVSTYTGLCKVNAYRTNLDVHKDATDQDNL